MALLNSTFVGGSLIGAIIMSIVSFGITFYSLYLNNKQAKVHEQMNDLIFEVQEIKEILKK